MSRRHFFSHTTKNLPAILSGFWHGTVPVLSDFWRKQTLSILSAADSFATDPVDLFWTEKEYLCFHGSSFVCLSDVYPTKMDRHICIQLFRL